MRGLPRGCGHRPRTRRSRSPGRAPGPKLEREACKALRGTNMMMVTPGGLESDDRSIDTAHLEDLRRVFRGELIPSGHAGYDVARRVWNGNIDRRPALIARCTGVA